MAERTQCTYNYGRCTYSVLSKNSTRLRSHWLNKHAEEYERERKRKKATKERTLAMEGLRAVYAGQIERSADGMELDDVQSAHMERINNSHNDILGAIAETTNTTFPLHISRRYDSPDPLSLSTSDDQETLVNPGGTLTDDEDADFAETQEALSGIYGVDREEDQPERYEGIDTDNDNEMHGEQIQDEETRSDSGKDRLYFNSCSDAAGETFDSNNERQQESEFEVVRVEEYTTAGRSVVAVDPTVLPLNESVSPWAPFSSPHDFKMGSWFIRHGATSSMITEGFNRGLLQQADNKSISFTSPYTLRKLVDQLEPGMGVKHWREGKARFFADKKNEWRMFYYRDISEMIKQFFRQPAFRDHMIYKPVREYNAGGHRVYSDLYTADWWWEKQETLQFGDTLVPILFASDATQLSTHSGDHDCWPIYMSIGNLPSTLRSKPSTNSWILVAILPMPPKKDDSLEKDAWGRPRCALTTEEREKYKAYKDDVLHQVLEIILKPLQSAMKKGMLIDCSDGNVRLGFPALAGWIADYQEYSKLYQINKDGCALCEVSFHQLGDNVIAKPRCPLRHDRELTQYRAIQERIRNAPLQREVSRKSQESETTRLKRQLAIIDQSFKLRQAKKLDNVLWRLGIAEVDAVWKPDMLHTIYQGMLKHILGWLKLFLEYHGRYARFNQVWLRIPSFAGLPEHKKTIGGNTQMTGKLLRNVLKCLLPCLLIALEGPVDTPDREQIQSFKECLTCVRYFVDFALVCRYKLHTNTTMGYLDTYLEGFHRHKHVFSEFRRKKKITGQKDETVLLEKAAELKRKRKHQLSQQTASLLRDLSKDDVIAWLLDNLPERVMDDTNAVEIEALIDKLAEVDGDRLLRDEGMFTIPKLHLLSHFSTTIARFGALQQFSTEIGETLHKGLKEAYRKSNKNNIVPQIAQYHTRQYAIRMRELNLLQLAKDGRHCQDIQNVLQLYADPIDKRLAARLNRTGSCDTALEAFLSDSSNNISLVNNGDDNSQCNDSNTVTDTLRFPVPKPLFRQIQSAGAERVFHSPLRLGCSRLDQIVRRYNIPHLLTATRIFLEADVEYKRLAIPDDKLLKCNTSAWTALHITTPSVQAEEPFETLKAVCTGCHASTRKQPRNDSVLFRDVESDDDDDASIYHDGGRKKRGTRRKVNERPTDFGPYALGNLKCLFKLEIPKPKYWVRHHNANDKLSEECYNTFRLAFVEVLEPIPVGKYGEMIPGPELARCRLPTGTTPYERGLLAHGGKVMEINSIERTAHLIPEHDDTNITDKDKVWIFNNRIDVGTWDLIYGNVY